MVERFNRTLKQAFTGTAPLEGHSTHQRKTECKVRGFSLHIVEGSPHHFNYAVLHQNTLDELHRPLDRPRSTRIHLSTAKTFPYGYRCPDEEEDRPDVTLDDLDLANIATIARFLEVMIA